MLILNSLPLANLLGFLALISYILTLLPTSIKTVFPATRKSQFLGYLLKFRRQLGILAFFLGFGHGFLTLIKRNIDLLDLQTYGISVEGTATLIIFALLAFTSNDWSIKKMKKNWRSLHQLTYTAMFLLFWHIMDKMSGHWNFITPVELICISGTIALFIRRRCIYHQTKNNHKIKQQSS